VVFLFLRAGGFNRREQMIDCYEAKMRVRRVGLTVLLAGLMVMASLGMLQLNVEAKVKSSGAKGCGTFAGAVDGAEEGDTIVPTAPDITSTNARPSAGKTITKSLTIQGGWSPPASGCASANQTFTDTADLLAFGYTFAPQNRSVLTHTGGPVLNISHTGQLTIQNMVLLNEGPAVARGAAISGTISGTNALLLIENVVISNGLATQAGGGLYLEVRGGARLVISDSQFFSNVATNAVGLSPGGGFEIHVYDNSELLIQKTTISTNTTDYRGGGGRIEIHDNGLVTVTNSSFSANNQEIAFGGSVAGGGGLYIEKSGGGSASVWLSQNDFKDNHARNGGGGLHLRGSGLNAYLSNNIFGRNSADSFGAGVYVNSGTVDMLHLTIADVTSNAQEGVYVDGGTVRITNTIIVSHNIGLNRTGGTVAEGYNLYFGNSFSQTGTIIHTGPNQASNPDLVNPAADDYHLGPNSAALDQGVNAGITIDFEGDPRPIGSGFDIGADERVVNSFLPIILKNSP
jgi:hypothetical protein